MINLDQLRDDLSAEFGGGHLSAGKQKYKGGGGGGSTNTVQKADPWKGVQPYIKDYLAKGQSLIDSPYQFYSGDTIAGFSPEQEQGMRLATQRAMYGSPTLEAANTSVTDTLSGKYLNPETNPYLKATVNQAMGDVQSRINSQFNNNNFGSSAHQELLTRNLGDVANNIYGQNYTNERNAMNSLASLAPTLAGADYGDAQQLMNVGAQRQGLAQQYLNQAQNQFNQAQQYPYQQIDRYGNMVSIGMGAGGTTTSNSTGQTASNPLTGALGGAAAGAGLASALNMSTPWGAGLGAAAGLLGGK